MHLSGSERRSRRGPVCQTKENRPAPASLHRRCPTHFDTLSTDSASANCPPQGHALHRPAVQGTPCHRQEDRAFADRLRSDFGGVSEGREWSLPSRKRRTDPDGLVFFLPIRGRHHRGRYQLAGDQATILLWFSDAKEWASVQASPSAASAIASSLGDRNSPCLATEWGPSPSKPWTYAPCPIPLMPIAWALQMTDTTRDCRSVEL